ncbi:MAG: NAD(P)/FAD-dependent oxidoreductase [Chloroflexota bacterium]
MNFDSIIVGGGPAGLNAALVLGRAKRNAILFDDNQPRNAVTQESHGYLTRDGVSPAEFRKIGHQEIARYPSISFRQQRVTDILPKGDSFSVSTTDGETVHAKTIILATGLKEKLPSVDHIHQFYGKSLFSCPYCDGWERRDKKLVIISEGTHTFHMAKTVWNWSREIVVCTNGHQPLTPEEREMLIKKDIEIIEDRIVALIGERGYLEQINFETHQPIRRETGFVTTEWYQAAHFGEQLGCDLNPLGGAAVDNLGRTSVSGVYAAGESIGMPSQLIIAASDGSRAAAAVNMDLIEREF